MLSQGLPHSFHGFSLPKTLPRPPPPHTHFCPSASASARASSFSIPSPKPSLYDLLELPPDVAPSDIKLAYRHMARKYHPDVCRSEESTRRFIEIQEAYETLSDPRRRAMYDQAVAMGLNTTAPGRMPWKSGDKDAESADWRSRWESQLSRLKRRSAMRTQKADSWASRVRRQNDL